MNQDERDEIQRQYRIRQGVQQLEERDQRLRADAQSNQSIRELVGGSIGCLGLLIGIGSLIGAVSAFDNAAVDPSAPKVLGPILLVVVVLGLFIIRWGIRIYNK